MEDELYAVAGLQPEGDAVVAIDAEAGRVPLDLFGDPGVCGQDGLPHRFHRIFPAVLETLQEGLHLRTWAPVRACLLTMPSLLTFVQDPTVSVVVCGVLSAELPT
jgi:hypothetical protein